MHIMYMLGILTFVFFAAVILMCCFREKLKHPLVNPLFIFVNTVFFFLWTLATYEHRGQKFNFLTFENISPYICTVISVTPMLNQRVKHFAYSAIAFLGFGMLAALYISPEVEYLFNHHQDAQMIHITEAACHLVMALYGLYLILSDKVKLELGDYRKGLVFIYISIGFGVFLNLVFKQSYFGMAMHGNYAIYFLDIFGSFEATLIAYILGVLAVMTLGFLVGCFVDRVSHKKEKHHENIEL